MIRTLSPEMDEWVERMAARQHEAKVALRLKAPEEPIPAVPPCPLDDVAFAWMWAKYQQASFPPASAAKRLARTPLGNLTLRGRNFAVRMAFKFRRQILGLSAAKMTEAEFLDAVRVAAQTKPVSP